MIDHANLPVSDTAASRAFYDAALRTLGYRVIAEDGPAVGYGTDCWSFGIDLCDNDINPLHLAFKAKSNTEVLAFYAAALANGGRDNGEPGPRPQYGDAYFAAYVLDPDGHNIEVVFRG